MNGAVHIVPESGNQVLTEEQSNQNKLVVEIKTLKEEKLKLISRLKKSESLRKDIEYKLGKVTESSQSSKGFDGIMGLKLTKPLRVGNEQAGLVFDLSDNMDVLRSLNEQLEIINHASRDGREHPMVIVAEKPLDIVSYPMSEQVASNMDCLNKQILDNCNMIGHIAVPQKRVEVTHGFAGYNGN